MNLTAPEHAAGLRLDQFLAEPLGSRSRAARLISSGAVLVDGHPVQKRYSIVGGEIIAVDETADPDKAVPEAEEHPAEFRIAYEDDDLIVVDKPAGLVVHPARGHRTGTLSQALGTRVAGGGDPERAGLVHRLDKDTSGLLVVARSEEVHRTLKAQLQAREITREYLALVEGRPPARSGTIEAPLGRDRRDRLRMSTDSDHAKPAVTHFELAEALPAHTLLRVRLETGRTHQIRAHLLAIGYPVAGDPDYGSETGVSAALGLRRQFLHAARLAFPHPVTGLPIEVTSPLPPDLERALALAGG